MLSKQLAGMPKEEQERALVAFEKNPDFFKKIAEDIQARIKGGEPQMAAVMAVVSKHKEELGNLLKG